MASAVVIFDESYSIITGLNSEVVLKYVCVVRRDGLYTSVFSIFLLTFGFL